MAIINRDITVESQDRYLTYALSVVTGRALPDVRDGLKPVQRRILYAMLHNLKLRPEGAHKKCAGIVGDVLAKFHPHGDVACYEALARMAQDFSLRYPLIDGQGNFGSIDGDSPAAYRYTEAKLRHIALDVIGEIDEETVEFIANFDASTEEPVVLPSRVPQLLINGASGIAVGMSTNIPPHNLNDTVRALIAISENPDTSDKDLAALIKAPDFPTGCMIVNTKSELESIYATGKGNVVMRGEWELEDLGRSKQAIIITSVPYGINKSNLVEKIAELIISRKLPQLVDVRDESTAKVRVVLELASGCEAEVAMAYLFKHTPLETNFSVNLTALTPIDATHRVPKLMNLRGILQSFIDFRQEVVRRRLVFEKKKLLERIHILEGFILIFDDLDTAIKIVRSSDGRTDAATKIAKRFKLTEIQSFAIVDLRIYQLSKTNINELRDELRDKLKRIAEIDKILASKQKIAQIVRTELQELADKYGDKRLSKIVKATAEIELNEADYMVKEDVHAIITKDGWLKRIRQSNEISTTRVREGDEITAALALNTVDKVAFLTSLGNLYALDVHQFPASSGYGSPVQKLLKFKDGENIVACFPVTEGSNFKAGSELILVTSQGTGLISVIPDMADIRKSGRRLMKLRAGDSLVVAIDKSPEILLGTKQAYCLKLKTDAIPVFTQPAIGVCLIDVRKEDTLVFGLESKGVSSVKLKTAGGRELAVTLKDLSFAKRATKGDRVSKNVEIVGVVK